MSRRKRIAQAAGLAGFGLLGLITAGRLAFFFPPQTLEVDINWSGPVSPLRSGDTVRVLVWNVQYAGSRQHHFFYDGGPDVHVPKHTVEETLDAIGEVIRRVDADIVLLQEVDRDAERTGHIDQLAALLAGAPYPCSAATPYHKVPYVPHPAGQHLGRVDMNLVVFSKFPLSRATRHALPLLDEPLHRRIFNLRRAVLEVAVPLHGGGEFRLFNTHLSAFSRGDGTLGRQVASLAEHMDKATEDGVPWVFAGDLNALPPGDTPTRLKPKDQSLYREETTPIQPLFERFTPSLDADAYANDPARWRTYVPFDADAADRTLDYIFHGGVEQVDYRVLTDVMDVSDHLPLVLEVRIP